MKIKEEFYQAKIRKSLVGRKSGKLEVFAYYGSIGKSKSYWICRCSCGKEKVLSYKQIMGGRYKSCGCSQRTQYGHGVNSPLWTGCGDISGKFFAQIKWGAKKRNIPLSISLEYLWKLFIKQNKKCALSGVDIRFSGYKEKCHATTASLDRKNASLGYIKGNVQWVHKDINWMKQDYSQEYFIEMCKKVAKNNA